MNRLDRFRFGQLHKRRIFVFILILALAILLAGGFIFALGVFGQRSEFVRVKLSSDLEGSYNAGIGINMSRMPSVNRIPNPSFEHGNTYRTYAIADTSTDFIFLENSQEIISPVGGGVSYVRVLSVGNDGVMTEMYRGRVTGFDEAGLGRAVYAEDPEGYFINGAPIALENIAGQYVALTPEGDIITGVFTDFPEKIMANETFVDMCKVNETLYFLSDQGNIYISSDASSLSFYRGFEPDEDYTLTGLEVLGNNICVVTDSGKIITLTSDRIHVEDLRGDHDDNSPIVTVRHDDTMIACCGSSVYISRNGLFFSELELTETYISDRIITAGTYCDGTFRLLCHDSSVVRLTVSDDNITCFRYPINGMTFTDICGTNTGLLTAVSDDGRAVILEGDRYMEIEPAGMTVDKIYEGISERIPVYGGGRLYLASVLSGIAVSDPVPSDNIIEGDMCILESECPDSEGIVWNALEDDTVFTITDSCAATYSRSACIAGQSDQRHSIWCDLGDVNSQFSANNFYRLSLQLRGIGMDNKPVTVWISGEQGGFGNVGFTIDNVSDRFTLESYVFAVTQNMTIAGEDLKLNISWEGTGMLFIDDLYLGEDKYDPEDLPTSVINGLQSSAPSAVRLSCLTMDSEGFDKDLYFGSGVTSLEKGLCLVRDLGSQPWLVIGSYADREDVDDLMTYFAGSVSTEYGKKRNDNGTALPWARQFDSIYIEITDSDDIFVSDSQRAAYVSYVIGLVRQSEYFSQMRDRIVFLDGMEYEGGVMLSNADSHCRGLLFENSDYSTGYSDADYESTRMAGRAVDNGEYISSLSFTADSRPSTAAGVINALMTENSAFVRMTMVDIEFSSCPVHAESDLIFAGDVPSDIASDISDRVLLMLGMIKDLEMYAGSSDLGREILDPLDMTLGVGASDFSNDCTVRLIENEGNVYLIVANHSQTRQQFLLMSGSYRLAGSDIMRYGADGKFLMKRNVLGIDRRQSIGPGEYLVIMVE